MPVAVTTPTKHIGEADVQTATQPVSPPHSAGPLEPLVDHEIAQLAYAYWEGRNRPFGTPFRGLAQGRTGDSQNSERANRPYQPGLKGAS